MQREFPKWMLLILIAVFAFGVTACESFVTGGENSRVSHAMMDAVDDKAGEVFGSMVFGPRLDGEPRYEVYKIDYRPVGDSTRSGFFMLSNVWLLDGRKSYNIDGPGYRGKTFAQRLAPGKYEIYDVEFALFGSVMQTFKAKQPFSVPFDVGQHEKVYLGRFVAHGALRKNMVGITVPNGGYFELIDAMAEDAALSRRSGPSLEVTQVRRAALSPDGAARLFLRSIR